MLHLPNSPGNTVSVDYFGPLPFNTRKRRSLRNDVPEHLFLCFFSFPKLFNFSTPHK